MLLGDTVMMTAGVRDLKKAFPDYRIRVETNCQEVWENNPYIESYSGYDEAYNIGPAIVTQGSKTNGLHFANAFRVCLEDKLKIKIPQGPLRGDLYLSEAEREPLIDGKYWLIDTGCGPYKTKLWRDEYWQEVVDKLDLNFVQVGVTGERLKGVVDYIGRTSLRDLFRLHFYSEGSLGLASAQMHIAGAFQKPCVTLLGAREPVSFNRYPTHRLIDNIGSLPCARHNACWRCRACDNQEDGISKCMDLIKPSRVICAVNSYYEGGVLEKPKAKVKPRPVLRIVCNAHTWGGAERSVVEIIKMARGYEVELATRKGMCDEFKKNCPPVKLTNKISSPCDALLLYASDMVFDFDKPEFHCFRELKAKRKVMALTYRIGKVGKEKWTTGWDLYLFLSSEMAEKVNGNKKVLPPPVDLDEFFKIEPDYNSMVIARHSSQGDIKYPQNIVDVVKDNPDKKFMFMPAPSFMPDLPNIIKYRENEIPVGKFLSKASCFLYTLPDGYADQGPRVVMEAMAAGLPVITEKRCGMKDRVTDAEGWFDTEIIKTLTPEMLAAKGKAARKRAKTFDKRKWLYACTNPG